MGDLEEWEWKSYKPQQDINTYITLSPCFLTSKDNIDTERSFYSIETIFGKHGNGTSRNQYIKNPLTLISSHALIKPNNFDNTRLFIGHGLGGNKQISKAVVGTVHQGYSIVVPVYVSAKKKDGKE